MGTDHFRIFYLESRATAERLAQLCEQFYGEIVDDLGPLPPDSPIDVWLAESEERFHSMNQAPIQDWAVAYAYPRHGRIVLQRPGVMSAMKLQFDTIVKHEIVHVVFGGRASPMLDTVPHWFSEGLAMALSEEWGVTHRWRLLGNRVSQQLIPLDELRGRFPQATPRAQLAYTESFSAVLTITQRGGPFALRTIVDMLALGYTFDDALIATVRMNLDNFEEFWLQSVQSRYQWIAILSSSFLLWGLVALGLVWVYLRRRRRQQTILERWQEEEEEIDPFFR